MDNLKSKSIKAFAWNFFGKVFNQGIAFVVSIFLARILAPEEFGQMAIIIVLFNFANMFMDVGLGASLVQRKRLHPIHFSSVFYFNILIGLLLAILTFFSAGFIAGFYGQPILKILMQVMSLSFVINSFGQIQNTMLSKALNFKRVASLQLISSPTSGVIAIIMAYKGFGVWSLLTQVLLNRFIYVVLVWIVVKWTPGFRFSLKALKQLWGFGFRIFISKFLNVLFDQLDVMIVGKIFPVATLGYLQRAKSLNKIAINFSSASLMQVLFPIFSTIHNELDRLKSIVNRSMHVLSFIVFLVFGLLYLNADNIIIIIYTEKWFTSIEYFKILVLSGMFYPFNALLVNIVKSRGDSKNFLKLNLLKKIPQGIVLCFGFIFGINGFLYGLVISAVISSFINFLYVNKELNTTHLWILKPMIPNFILSFVLIILIVFLLNYYPIPNHYYAILLKSTIFIPTYILASYLFKLRGLKIIFEIIKAKK